MKSKLFSLNRSDVFKAAQTAAGAAVLAGAYSGSLTAMGAAAVTSFLGSLIRRFFTNTDDKLASEPKI